jgi:hypothetical protein
MRETSDPRTEDDEFHLLFEGEVLRCSVADIEMANYVTQAVILNYYLYDFLLILACYVIYVVLACCAFFVVFCFLNYRPIGLY